MTIILKDEPTVTGSSALAVSHWLSQQGVDVAALVAAAEVSLEGLDRQDSRLPLAAFNRLLDQVALALQDPAVGLRLGSWIDSSRMGVIGHIVFNNRTLQQALEQYERLSSLVNEGVVVRFEVEADEAILHYACPDAACYHPINLERMLAQAVTRARRFVSERIFLRQVSFAHAPRAPLEHYTALFQCPVQFSAPTCRLSFDSSFLGFELPHRNPFLHQALSRHVESLMKKLEARRKVSTRVRRLLDRQLSRGAADAVQIAEQMAMSRQTLYRRLKQENVSFHSLVEEVRQQKALRYLQSGRYSMSEIAFLLGFSEQSAFSRAFKRWTGRTPADYRRQR